MSLLTRRKHFAPDTENTAVEAAAEDQPQQKRRRNRRAAKPDQPKLDRTRLSLRSVRGHLTFTGSQVWAWYVLSPVQWSFGEDAARIALIDAAAQCYVDLAPTQIRLRVTDRPFPTRAWAAHLDRRTPRPLPDVQVDGAEDWLGWLARQESRIAEGGMSDKLVYLGVRASTRLTRDRMYALIDRRLDGEARRIAEQVDDITEVVARAGLSGRPARPAEMEYLLRRSRAIGLPAPSFTASPGHGLWLPEDIDSFADEADHYPHRFGKTVEVSGVRDGSRVTRHVAVLSVGHMEFMRIPEEMDPWMLLGDRLPFGVEWSSTVDLYTGEQVKGWATDRRNLMRSQERHYDEHDEEYTLAMERAVPRARQVIDEVSESNPLLATRAWAWHRIAVWGRDERECLQRAEKVKAAFKPKVAIQHPGPGQVALLAEFMPGEPVTVRGYQRRGPVRDTIAAGMPTVTSQVGDGFGPYLGYTCGAARRPVLWDPHYSTEVLRNSGLTAVAGGLGAGKSILLAKIGRDLARRGVPTVMFDPSGPQAALTHMPELAPFSRHFDLTKAERGSLNWYLLVPDPDPRDYEGGENNSEYINDRMQAVAERKMLGQDTVLALLPESVRRNAQTEIVVSDAIGAVGGHITTTRNGVTVVRTPWDVIDALEASDNPQGKVVANYLREVATLPRGLLLFPDPDKRDEPYTAETWHRDVLTVITMPGLVQPPAELSREHWNSEERLSQPLMHLAVFYATRLLYGLPMKHRKACLIDEKGQLGKTGSGRALLVRLGRDSRKWNAAVVVASQDPRDVLGEQINNWIQTAFVGRITDAETQREAMPMLRVTPGQGYEDVLGTLSPPRDMTRRGEFIMRDPDGRVEKIRIDPDEALLAAMSTDADDGSGWDLNALEGAA